MLLANILLAAAALASSVNASWLEPRQKGKTTTSSAAAQATIQSIWGQCAYSSTAQRHPSSTAWTPSLTRCLVRQAADRDGKAPSAASRARIAMSRGASRAQHACLVEESCRFHSDQLTRSLSSPYYSQCVPPTVGGSNPGTGNSGGTPPNNNPGGGSDNVPSGYVTSVVVITYTQVVGEATTLRTTIVNTVVTTIPVAEVTTQTFTELVPAPTTAQVETETITLFQTLTRSSSGNVVYVTRTVTVGDDGGDDGDDGDN
jgi:hypothetical protein